jgi:hypothetical protein
VSRLPVPGSDDGTWGNILNDYLSVSLDTDGSIKAGAVASKANVSHTHAESDVTSLSSDLAGKEATANKGAASGYAPLDGSSKLPLANLPHHASTHALGGADPVIPSLMLPPFTAGGSLSLSTGTSRLPIDSTYSITGVRLMANTAPVGAAVIVDVLKNGSTIFTTPANRPTIADGAHAGGPGPAPDVTGLAAGDYLTVNIAQVGSTNPGADLVVSILAQRLA